MSEPTILLDGLGIPESPRWHEDRLWFCNWIDRQVMAVDLDGKADVMATRDPVATRWATSSTGCPTAGCCRPATSWGARSPTGR